MSAEATKTPNPTDKATGLERLICNMLRAQAIRGIKDEEYRHYLNKAGVALHTLPHHVAANTQLEPHELRDINALDTSGSEMAWGNWVRELCGWFGQDLPAITTEVRR